jgi:hypothetical protein
VTLRWAIGSAAAGAVAGACYVLSPITACAVAAAIAVLPALVRGLPETDRRWLVWIVAAAIAARLLAIGGLFAINMPRHDDQFLGASGGDEAYAMSRALRTRDIVLGGPTGKYDYFVANDDYGRNSYVAVLTLLEVVFGPTPYGLRLLNALLFLCASLLLFRVAHRAYGATAAFGGLVVLLFWPTLFAWSISLLKEPLYFLCGAILLTGVVHTARAPTAAARVLSVAAAAAATWAARDLRPAALGLMVGGIATGLIAALAFRSKRTAAVTACVAVAALAIAVTPPAQRRIIAGLESAAKIHTGHVFTVGHAYKLLDAGFYVKPATPSASSLTLTHDEAARYVVRAAGSFVAVPPPWQLQSARELAYLPEQLAWYVLVALLVAGGAAALRRDRLVTCLFVGFVLPTAGVLALTNGNVGTLLRLRGLVIPYLVWVSAAGVAAAVDSVDRKERMPFIDDRGRVFGRINLFDAAVAAFVVVLIPLAYGTYLLFRTAPAKITSVVPALISREERRVSGGSLLEAKLKVRGDGFHPMLRATIDSTPALAFVYEDPHSADVLVPVMDEGRYDLVLYDGVQEVARAPKAVVIGPQVPERTVTAHLRLTAPDEVLALVRPGDHDGRSDAWTATVLEVGRRTAVPGGASAMDVTVRLGLDRGGSGWVYREKDFKAGAPIVLSTDRYVIDGVVVESGL